MEIETVVLEDDELVIDGTLSLAESFQMEELVKKQVYRLGKIGKQTNTFKDRHNFRTNIKYIVGGDAQIEYTSTGKDKMTFHLEYGESPKATKLLDTFQERFGQIPKSKFKTDEEYYSKN